MIRFSDKEAHRPDAIRSIMPLALANLHDVRIGCAISHTDEATLDLCLEALKQQSVAVRQTRVFSGTPRGDALMAA